MEIDLVDSYRIASDPNHNQIPKDIVTLEPQSTTSFLDLDLLETDDGYFVCNSDTWYQQ